MHVLGDYDYAGGGPIHLASGSKRLRLSKFLIILGAAGLAFALVCGKRDGFGKDEFRPHSLSTVFLGTSLLWFGWFGFVYVSRLTSLLNFKNCANLL
jgi:Amt family ammonium transporter